MLRSSKINFAMKCITASDWLLPKYLIIACRRYVGSSVIPRLSNSMSYTKIFTISVSEVERKLPDVIHPIQSSGVSCSKCKIGLGLLCKWDFMKTIWLTSSLTWSSELLIFWMLWMENARHSDGIKLFESSWWIKMRSSSNEFIRGLDYPSEWCSYFSLDRWLAKFWMKIRTSRDTIANLTKSFPCGLVTFWVRTCESVYVSLVCI